MMNKNYVSCRIRSHRVWAGCVLLAFPVLGMTQVTSGAAQQATTSSANGDLEAIIVTAQKRSERLQDVPVSISAFTTADLQRSGVTGAADLPSVVAGLVWSNQGVWVEPNLRGVSTNVAAIGSSSPIAIYLDGIYQPSQSGSIFDLPDVSRIEVLKGPQGTLFGRNATGGAISIYTLDPSFTTTGHLEASAGAYTGGAAQTAGHYAINGYISGPLVGDTLAGGLSFSYDTTDGWLTDDLTGKRGGKVQSSLVRGKLLWQPSDTVKIVATGFYSQREDEAAETGVPQNGVTIATAYPGSVLPSNQPWHYTYTGQQPVAYQDIRGASLKAEFDLSAGTLTSLTGFTNTGVAAPSDLGVSYSPACVAVFACIDAYIQPRDQAVSQEFDFASKKMGGFSYIAGLFGLYDVGKEHDSYNGGLFSDDTVVVTHAIALFAEGTYEFTDQFSTIVGVRGSRDSLNAKGRDYTADFAVYGDKSWNSLTPRASFIYKWTNEFNSYFTYSQGFKAGIVSGQISPNPAPPANPEKIRAYEIGFKGAAADYTGNIAAFYYDYRNLQVEIFNDLVTTPENAAQAEIYGLDFDGSAKLSDSFVLRLSSCWLPTAKYKSFPHAVVFVPPVGPGGLVTDNDYDASGSRMLASPKFTGTLSGTYTHDFPEGSLEATGSVYHSTEYRWEYTNMVTTSAYTLLNGNVSFTPHESQFKYSVYGKNLTNKAYVQGALATAFSNEIFWARPREVGVKVGYSF